MMGAGHQEMDGAEARYQNLVRDLPSRPLNFRHRPMGRQRAYEVCIAFGRATDMPIQPKLTSDGGSYDAQIPMSYLEGLLESLELLEPA